jgi:hypothetical protein
VVQQSELFGRVAAELGHTPPVSDGADVLADPRGVLSHRCTAAGHRVHRRDVASALGTAGRRASDRVWTLAWYDAVERSSGFNAASAAPADRSLGADQRRIADAARPHYQALARYKLTRSR